MADRTTRDSARIATLVALPIALLAGVLVYLALRPPAGAHPSSTPSPTPQNTAPVAMSATPLADRPATVCRAVFARLPDQLGGLVRRPVTAGAEQNAAYGDPPVLVACGAPGLSAPAGAQFLRLNDLCWYAETGPDATQWSLLGREVPMRVTVPNRYEGQLLVGLADAVQPAVPKTGPDPCA
jgi:hypothetical protein